MTPSLAALIGTLGGFALAALAVLWLHERREFRRQDVAAAAVAVANLAHEQQAQYRERRAVERHDLQMAALSAARVLTLGAINQRARLEIRAAALEAASNDHADHLEALGRVGVGRVRVGGDS